MDKIWNRKIMRSQRSLAVVAGMKRPQRIDKVEHKKEQISKEKFILTSNPKVYKCQNLGLNGKCVVTAFLFCKKLDIFC